MTLFKKLNFFLFSLLLTGQVNAQIASENTVTKLYPKAAFDSIMAKNALQQGNSTIKGEAFYRPNQGGLIKMKTGSKIIGKNIEVFLFPVTPSLLEYLSLRKKINRKKQIYAYMNPVAEKYHRTSLTDGNGEFSFVNVKPGKYFVEAYIPWEDNFVFDRYMSTDYTHNSVTTNYQREYYTNSGLYHANTFVEITSGGETKEIKVK